MVFMGSTRGMIMPFWLGEIKCASQNDALGFVQLSKRTREHVAFLSADFTRLTTASWPDIKLDTVIIEDEIREGKGKERKKERKTSKSSLKVYLILIISLSS